MVRGVLHIRESIDFKDFITDEMIQGDIESFLGAVAVCADEMERQFTDEDMY